MSWTAIDLIGLQREVCERASAILFDQGATGVQERWRDGEAPPPRQPWDVGPQGPLPDRLVLTAWFDAPHTSAVMHALASCLDSETAVVWRQEEERDWQAEIEARFQPFTVGAITITPPWHPVPDALIIEPGSGFGTGEHPTTRQALALFQTLPPCATALDIGCGSGILALAAARAGLAVHGIDIDPPALSNAHSNAALNGLDATFDGSTPEQLTPADLVFANIHAEQLVEMAPQLIRLTRRHLLLAGILVDREHTVTDCFPWPVHSRLQDGEWVALRLDRL